MLIKGISKEEFDERENRLKSLSRAGTIKIPARQQSFEFPSAAQQAEHLKGGNAQAFQEWLDSGESVFDGCDDTIGEGFPKWDTMYSFYKDKANKKNYDRKRLLRSRFSGRKPDGFIPGPS